MEGLTYEDFCGLPEAERSEAYKRLEERDKFRVRISMDTTSKKTEIPCNTCRNRKKVGCTAFPDGLTADIVNRKIRNPAEECANGIYYQEKK